MNEVKIAREFLPRGVRLEDWVQRRIGSEVRVDEEGKGGQPVFRLPPISKDDRDELRQNFFNDLPPDEFTPEEMRLREQILDFLDSKPNEVVTLSNLGSDKQFAATKRAFLPEGVPLKEWIERRASSEFALETSPRGQFVIRYIGDAGGEGELPIEDSAQDAPPEGMSPEEQEARQAEKDAKKNEEDLERIEKREKWYNELPEDSLTDQEAALRDALMDFIERWSKANNTPPSLSNAGSDNAVRDGRAALLPKFISLRDWIENRIGGEIELVHNGSSSEVFFGFRGSIDMAAVDKAAAGLKVSKRGRLRDTKGKGRDHKGGGKRSARGPTPNGGKGKGRSGEAPQKRRRL
jgi:hypothetical protein